MSLLSFTKKITGRAATKPKTKAAAKKTTNQGATKTAVATVMPVHAGLIGLVPLVTEKTVRNQGAANVVAFRVRPGASKGQIMKAVADRYKVTPTRIRTMQMTPKRRTRGNTVGSTPAWKKAYVTLPSGSSIDLSV